MKLFKILSHITENDKRKHCDITDSLAISDNLTKDEAVNTPCPQSPLSKDVTISSSPCAISSIKTESVLLEEKQLERKPIVLQGPNKRKVSAISCPSESPNKKHCLISEEVVASKKSEMDSKDTKTVASTYNVINIGGQSRQIISLGANNTLTVTPAITPSVSSEERSQSTAISSAGELSIVGADCTITRLPSKRKETPVLRSTAARQLTNTVSIQPTASGHVTRQVRSLVISLVSYSLFFIYLFIYFFEGLYFQENFI